MIWLLPSKKNLKTMAKKNNYEPYSEYDIHLFFAEPREICDRPYMLHAAFLLNCLFEAYTPDDDEEEQPKLEDTWDWEIPKTILHSIVKNANEQFVYASDHGTQIDVWNNGFTIRKVNAYDKTRLADIFNFPSNGDNYIVTKSGVMNLAGISRSEAQRVFKDEFSDNKSYLRKVIMVAEDDAHDGWDKLTDMEVTMYLWALFYRKHESENDIEFRSLYKKDLYTSAADDKSCWNAVAQLHSKPHGLYTFSAPKVREWNAQHNQPSIIDSIDAQQAEDYWYTTAIKSTFK